MICDDKEMFKYDFDNKRFVHLAQWSLEAGLARASLPRPEKLLFDETVSLEKVMDLNE